jgi:DNA polymerase-3 subunit beta
MSGNLDIETVSRDNSDRFVICSGTRSLELPMTPSEDFPSVGTETSEVVGGMGTQGLIDALKRVLLCASDDAARPVLTSIALVLSEHSRTLQLVATDSYRLGIVDLEMLEPAAITGTFLLPTRVAAIAAKQLRAKEQESVDFLLPAHGVRQGVGGFHGSRIQITGTLVEGEFPNWQAITPAAVGGHLEIDADELRGVLNATSAISCAGAPVRIELNGSCSLVYGDPQSGILRQTLATGAWSPGAQGDEMLIAFNPSYLIDAIEFMGEKSLQVFIQSPLKPALFSAAGRRHVLMPVRL